jgi:hypothetical protein
VDRASGFEPEGRGFESLRACQFLAFGDLEKLAGLVDSTDKVIRTTPEGWRTPDEAIEYEKRTNEMLGLAARYKNRAA